MDVDDKTVRKWSQDTFYSSRFRFLAGLPFDIGLEPSEYATLLPLEAATCAVTSKSMAPSSPASGDSLCGGGGGGGG